MLRINFCFSKNHDLDTKIKANMCSTIVSYMDIMLDRTVKRLDGVLPDKMAICPELMSAGEKLFCQTYGQLYPKWFPAQKMFLTFSALYTLLADKRSDHTPTIEQEFLLASIIHVLAAQNAILETWGIRLTAEDMAWLMDDLLDEAANYAADGVHYTAENATYDAESYVIPCKEWLEYLFDDSDYELLNEMDTDTLRQSDLNARIGAVDVPAVVDDWWDKDF